MRSTTKSKGLQYSSKPWIPSAYMKRAVKWLLEHSAAGLFLDPGLRKTSITLAAFKILQREGMASRALVIAPMRVANSVWPGEVEKWQDFEHLRVVNLHGSNKDALLSVDADIYTINPEGLQWLLSTEKIKYDADGDKVVVNVPDLRKFRALKIDTLIVDESTKFKNPSSSRSKWLGYALGKFARRWILTGSPAPNGLMDIFYQMYICDQGATLGAYITAYRKKYFVEVNKEYRQYELQKGADEKIYKAIKPHVLRLEAGDYIDIPKLLDNPVVVELSSKARKLYDDMELDLFSQLDKMRLSAVSQSTAMQKCEQIAGGAVYKNAEDRTKKSAYVTIDDAKMEALIDLLEERSGKPTMIMYWFEHERERIEAALKRAGIGPGVNLGKLSPTKQRQAESDWNHNKFVYMLGQPASIGHGLNLQEGDCDAIIWYTLPYDLELYEQTWRRLVRSGSKQKVIINHILMAKNTVDAAKWALLKMKDKRQKKLLDALKTYRSTRRIKDANNRQNQRVRLRGSKTTGGRHRPAVRRSA